MLKISCSKCGASQQVKSRDVPHGGTTVPCKRCGNPIRVAGTAATAASGGGGIGLGAPGTGVEDLPAPKLPSTSGLGLGLGLELDDLPAPVAPGGSAMLDDGVDLPAPVGARGSISPGQDPIDNLPAPARGPSGISIENLPAPVAPRGSSRPQIPDLPAPRQASRQALSIGDDLPMPASGTKPISDLPAPVSSRATKPTFDNLPAPKNPLGDLPTPARKSAAGQRQSGDFFEDLPAPAESVNILDVPAPKGFFDNEKPAAPSGAPGDVPAPKGFFDDLPGLTQSGGGTDVPAPKGFFDDMPAPKPPSRPVADLEPLDLELGPPGQNMTDSPPSPAASLDIDDLGLDLAPASSQARSGLDHQGLGLPDPRPGDKPPLPSGPGLSNSPAPSLSPPAEPSLSFSAEPSLSLPAEPSLSPPAEPALSFSAEPSLSLPAEPSLSPPAEPSLSLPAEPSLSPPAEPALSLPDSLSLSSPAEPSPRPAAPVAEPRSSVDNIELASASSSAPLDLALDSPSLEPVGNSHTDLDKIDIGGSKPAPAAPDLGDDLGLDLPDISTPGGSPPAAKSPARSPGGFEEVKLPSIPHGKPAGVSFKKSPEPAVGGLEVARPKPARRKFGMPEDDIAIEIDQDAVNDVAVQKKKGTVAAADPQLALLKKRRARRLRIAITLSVLLIAGLGAGGFYVYNEWQTRQQLAKFISTELESAEKIMLSDRSGHWSRAAMAAERVLERDPNNTEALGIAAQAHLAGLLDEGTRVELRNRSATKHMQKLAELAATGPNADKARALNALKDGKVDEALSLIQGVLELSPDDVDAKLFIGWVRAAENRHKMAEKEFAGALEAAPNRKIPALYGMARAQLAQGKKEDAQKTFASVLELREDHFGALLGAIEAADIADFSELENRYLAILQRGNLEGADQKAVSRAWSLAGDQALEGGRIDEAAARFARANQTNRGNIPARIGLARVQLAREEFNEARKTLDPVRTAQPRNIEAALTDAELMVHEGKLDEALKLADNLVAQEAAIANQRDEARIHMVRGAVLRARAENMDAGPDRTQATEEALAAFGRARELTGPRAVRPAVAMAQLLTSIDQPEKAREMLVPVEAKAAADPVLAMTLGRVYANAKAPDRAETWFRKTIELRPEDAEAKFQLGLALKAQRRGQEAAEAMSAALEGAPKRADIGLQLAILYEDLERNDEAIAAYRTLLEGTNPSINTLVRAGRLFARTGAAEEAEKLAASILENEPDNPTGLYLRGVGEFAREDYEAAKRSFREAASLEPDARYLEAQGRAAEKLETYEDALSAYTEASILDKTYLEPLLGLIRVRLLKRQYDKALEHLAAALKLAPERASLHRDIGICVQEQGETKKSIDHFKRALRFNNKDALTHYHLGQAYFDLSDQRKAARELEAATRLADPDAAWLVKAYLNLGYAQRSRNNRREAIDAWEEYLARNPTSQAELAEVRRLLMRLKAR